MSQSAAASSRRNVVITENLVGGSPADDRVTGLDADSDTSTYQSNGCDFAKTTIRRKERAVSGRMGNKQLAEKDVLE